MKNNKVLVVVGVVALGGIAFLGYKMWKNRQEKNDNNFLNARGGLSARGGKTCTCANGYTAYCGSGNCDGCCRGMGGAKVR